MINNMILSPDFCEKKINKHEGCGVFHFASSKEEWWLGTESNRRHADFQSAALPTELQRHIKPLLQPDNGDHEGTRTLDLRRDRPAL